MLNHKYKLVLLTTAGVAALVAGSVAGFYILQSANHNSQDQAAESPTAESSGEVAQPTNTQSDQDGSPADNYKPGELTTNFTIDEWGIQFKVAVSLDKLTYAVIDDNLIGFAFSGWEEIDTNCSASKGAAGILARYDSNTATDRYDASFIDRQLGDYHYVFTGPQSPCSMNDKILDEQTRSQTAINLRHGIATSLTFL